MDQTLHSTILSKLNSINLIEVLNERINDDIYSSYSSYKQINEEVSLLIKASVNEVLVNLLNDDSDVANNFKLYISEEPNEVVKIISDSIIKKFNDLAIEAIGDLELRCLISSTLIKDLSEGKLSKLSYIENEEHRKIVFASNTLKSIKDKLNIPWVLAFEIVLIVLRELNDKCEEAVESFKFEASISSKERDLLKEIFGGLL